MTYIYYRSACVINLIVIIMKSYDSRPTAANTSKNKLCAWRHNMPPPPASWQYLRIYSPGGTCSGMLAI